MAAQTSGLSNLLPVSYPLTASDLVVHCDVIASYANPSVTVLAYFQTPGGLIESTAVTLGALAAETFGSPADIDIGGKQLISVCAGTGDHKELGELYIKITLKSASIAGANDCHVLAAGYLSFKGQISWPSAQVPRVAQDIIPTTISLQPSAPAAGAEMVFNNTTGFGCKRLKAVRARLTTNATVANRVVSLILTGPTGAAHIIGQSQTAQAASLTIDHYFAPYPTQFAAVANVSTFIPIPPNVSWGRGWTLQTSTSGIQAGDQFVNTSSVMHADCYRAT